MSTIKPPVSLDNADNEHRVDYIQNVASQPDYEITQVSYHSIVHHSCLLLTRRADVIIGCSLL